MQQFTDNLYAQMQVQLQNAERSTGNLLQVAVNSSGIVYEHLKELRAFIKDYKFKSQEEEILFFKEILPSFQREGVYFMKVYDIESLKPVGSSEALKSHYQDWIAQTRSFFERNRFLYLYHRMDKSLLDHKLFVREPEDLLMLPSYSLDPDPHFSNAYSYKLAKIQGLENIVEFLESNIRGLEHPEGVQPMESALIFTGSKAQFYELGYALQAAGVFNNGNASLKQVFDHLQYCCRIKAGNYYGYFQAMRIRKKNRTPFMDLLKEFVVRKMDESDEFPRYS